MGITGVDQLNELCECCISAENREFSKVFEMLDAILQKGVSVDQLVVNFTDYFRNLLLIKNGITKESLLGQSVSRFSEKVRQTWDSVMLERALSCFTQLYRDIRYSISPRYELELAVSRLCWLSSYISPRDVKAAVDSTRHLLSGAPKPQPGQGAATNPDPFYTSSRVQAGEAAAETETGDSFFTQLKKDLESKKETEPQPQPKPENPLPAAPVVAEPVVAAEPVRVYTGKELWEKAITEIQHENAMLASLLMQIAKYQITDNSVILHTKNEFSKNKLLEDKAYLNSVFKKLGGDKIDCSRVYEEETPVEQEGLPRQIEILCETFKGEVVL